NFFLIAGPCVIEDKNSPAEIAKYIAGIADRLHIPFIFKASYRKANRSSVTSFTGIGDDIALEIIYGIGRKYQIPTITDIHTSQEAEKAAAFVDMLQIPAFLCRQTDILIAAAKTGKMINIKKGQFLSAQSMKFALEKIKQTGNNNIILTERGNMFGYGDLIVDFRNIYEMKQFGVPVVLDVTHSLQQPNQSDGVTGGKPELINTIAKAGIATGVDGIFIETHPEPNNALSDGANMLKLDKLETLLKQLLKIHNALR
ncbi:3-deoxy-8-phosphooctulonate synthase, partial [candidate division KSB1 bacterium]